MEELYIYECGCGYTYTCWIDGIIDWPAKHNVMPPPMLT